MLVEKWEDLFHRSQKPDFFKTTHLKNKNILAITLNTPEFFEKSIDFFQKLFQENPSLLIELYVFPKFTYLLEVILKKKCYEKVSNCLTYRDNLIHNLSLNFFDLEDDLFSLELDDTMSQLYWDKDSEIITYLSESLFKFQILFGQFKNIVSIGTAAHDIQKKLESITVENQQDIEGFSDTYETLVIFDRCSDLITLMVP